MARAWLKFYKEANVKVIRFLLNIVYFFFVYIIFTLFTLAFATVGTFIILPLKFVFNITWIQLVVLGYIFSQVALFSNSVFFQGLVLFWKEVMAKRKEVFDRAKQSYEVAKNRYV